MGKEKSFWDFLKTKYDHFVETNSFEKYSEMVETAEKLRDQGREFNIRNYETAKQKLSDYKELKKALEAGKIDKKHIQFYRCAIHDWLFEKMPFTSDKNDSHTAIDFNLFPSRFKKSIIEVSKWEEISKVEYPLQGFFNFFFDEIEKPKDQELYEKIVYFYRLLQKEKSIEDIIKKLKAIEKEF